MTRLWWVAALGLLTGCDNDPDQTTCKQLIALAQTHTDTVVVLSSRPSTYGSTCLKALGR